MAQLKSPTIASLRRMRVSWMSKGLASCAARYEEALSKLTARTAGLQGSSADAERKGRVISILKRTGPLQRRLTPSQFLRGRGAACPVEAACDNPPHAPTHRFHCCYCRFAYGNSDDRPGNRYRARRRARRPQKDDGAPAVPRRARLG